MNWRNTLLATATSVSLFACSGTLEWDNSQPPSPDASLSDDNAESVFIANEIGDMLAKCAGGTCHSGPGTAPSKFLGDGDPSSFYQAITAYPSVHGLYDPVVAGLLTKVAGGLHSSMPDWTEGQRSMIEEWLTAEDDARTDEVEPMSMQVWSACMTQQNWDQSEMGQWALKKTNAGATCAGCHNDGLARFNTNLDNKSMFVLNQYEVFISGFFVDVAGDIQPAVDKLTKKGAGDADHPAYIIGAAEPAFVALQTFYDLTVGLKGANACASPGFPTTPPPIPGN